MANDLATVLGKLNTQLSDTANTVWSQTEKEDVLKWALSQLDLERPRVVREIVTLVDDTDTYALTSVASIHRVDLLDEDDALVMPLPGGTWEMWGDGITVGSIFINKAYARTGWTLRVHGYASFDLTTNYPPDRMVPTLLAVARAELLRRQINRRADFKNWSTLNQTSNSSVNELIQMINEADAEAMRLKREQRLIQRPKPGRIG